MLRASRGEPRGGRGGGGRRRRAESARVALARAALRGSKNAPLDRVALVVVRLAADDDLVKHVEADLWGRERHVASASEVERGGVLELAWRDVELHEVAGGGLRYVWSACERRGEAGGGRRRRRMPTTRRGLSGGARSWVGWRWSQWSQQGDCCAYEDARAAEGCHGEAEGRCSSSSCWSTAARSTLFRFRLAAQRRVGTGYSSLPSASRPLYLCCRPATAWLSSLSPPPFLRHLAALVHPRTR